jgi:DNA-binding CsgD family transcriptional regulator
VNAQERALARDLVARARLAADVAYQIKAGRRSGQIRQHGAGKQAETPTTSELMLLRYLSRGLTLPMIADAMGVSVESVKTGLKRARQRLRAKNSTHAVAEAIRRGLIP